MGVPALQASVGGRTFPPCQSLPPVCFFQGDAESHLGPGSRFRYTAPSPPVQCRPYSDAFQRLPWPCLGPSVQTFVMSRQIRSPLAPTPVETLSNLWWVTRVSGLNPGCPSTRQALPKDEVTLKQPARGAARPRKHLGATVPVKGPVGCRSRCPASGRGEQGGPART